MFSRTIERTRTVFGRKLKNTTTELQVESCEPATLLLNPYSYSVGGPTPRPLLIKCSSEPGSGFDALTTYQGGHITIVEIPCVYEMENNDEAHSELDDEHLKFEEYLVNPFSYHTHVESAQSLASTLDGDSETASTTSEVNTPITSIDPQIQASSMTIEPHNIEESASWVLVKEAKLDNAIPEVTVRLVPKTYALRRSEIMTFNVRDDEVASSVTPRPSADRSTGFSKVSGMKVPREQAMLEMMMEKEKNEPKDRPRSMRNFALRR